MHKPLILIAEDDPDDALMLQDAFSEINQNIPKEKAKFTPVETPPAGAKPILADGTYTVVKGDTLYSLSKKFNISIEELKRKNNMTDNSLSLGQTIIVK